MIKTEKKLQKPYLKDYNLLVEQDLWHVHYHILSITFWKEFIKSNVNMDMIIEKFETCEIKCKDCQCYTCKLKNDLIENKCLCLYQNYQNTFDEF